MPSARQFERRDFLRLLGLAGAGAVGLGTLAACGGSTAGSGSGSTGGSGKQQHMATAASHWESLVHYAPIYAGAAKGFFDKVILDVTGFAGGSDTVRAVTTGTNKWAIASGTGPVLADASGEDLVLTSSWFNQTDVSFMAAPDSKIKSPADLKDKKVAQSKPGSNTEYLIKKALSEAGIDENEVTIVSLGGAAEQTQGLKSGVVDVISVTEPDTSLLEKQGTAKVVFAGRDIASPWMELCGTPLRPFFKDNKDLFVEMHASLQKCIDFADSSPDEAASLWAKAIKLDEDIAAKAVKRYAGTDTWSLGFDKDALKNLSEASEFLKVVDSPIDWSKFIDQSALPEKLRISL